MAGEVIASEGQSTVIFVEAGLGGVGGGTQAPTLGRAVMVYNPGDE